MSDQSFVIKKTSQRNDNVLKQIDDISKRASHKIYGDEVPEKLEKKLLVGFTPTQHKALLKYCTDCKINGIEKHDNIGKLVRDLVAEFIDKKQL